jgi:hypothetical protein
MMKKIIASILLLLPVCAVAMDRSPIMIENKTKISVTIVYPEETNEGYSVGLSYNRRTIKPDNVKAFPISGNELFTLSNIPGFRDAGFIVSLSSTYPIVIAYGHAEITKKKRFGREKKKTVKAILVTQGENILATLLPEK